MDAHAGPRLVFEIEGQRAEFAPLEQPDGARDKRFHIGKCADNDLVCRGEFTSREHAAIEFYRDDFYLVDTSTNGTYVQSEDERVTHVHRARVRLWGSGWLSLGNPLHAANPIHFRRV